MFTDFKISYSSDGVKTEHAIDIPNCDLLDNFPYYLATAVGKSAKDAGVNPDIFLEQLAYELDREIEIHNPYDDEDEDVGTGKMND